MFDSGHRPARLREELADFLGFVRRPDPGARLSPRQDWLGGLSAPRLLVWALALWGVNLLLFGPLANLVADSASVHSRVQPSMLLQSWLRVVLWAPVMEELVFRYPLRWLYGWRGFFPWVFHAATLAFAMAHLINFHLGGAALWLLPALVLPQWMAGLVLGWMRVRFGIGASMALHSLFNAGPMALTWLAIWLAQYYYPGA